MCQKIHQSMYIYMIWRHHCNIKYSFLRRRVHTFSSLHCSAICLNLSVPCFRTPCNCVIASAELDGALPCKLRSSSKITCDSAGPRRCAANGPSVSLYSSTSPWPWRAYKAHTVVFYICIMCVCFVAQARESMGAWKKITNLSLAIAGAFKLFQPQTLMKSTRLWNLHLDLVRSRATESAPKATRTLHLHKPAAARKRK